MSYNHDMKLPRLVWDAWNKEHIKKHKVTVSETEESYQNLIGRSGSYDNREMFFGITKKGRLITISVSYEKQKQPYVVSVRDMSKKERRKYL
jgi:uncharacterized DUF497 family protein